MCITVLSKVACECMAEGGDELWKNQTGKMRGTADRKKRE